MEENINHNEMFDYINKFYMYDNEILRYIMKHSRINDPDSDFYSYIYRLIYLNEHGVFLEKNISVNMIRYNNYLRKNKIKKIISSHQFSS